MVTFAGKITAISIEWGGHAIVERRVVIGLVVLFIFCTSEKVAHGTRQEHAVWLAETHDAAQRRRTADFNVSLH